MQKELPLLSRREGCLGICTLMFRNIAEGFTKCALWFLPSKATSNSKFQSRAAINMINPYFRFCRLSDELQQIQANTWGCMRWHGVHLPVLFIDLILPFSDFRIYAVSVSFHMLMATMWGRLVYQSSWSSLVDGSSRHLIGPLNCIFEIGSLKMHCKKNVWLIYEQRRQGKRSTSPIKQRMVPGCL